MIGQFLGHYRVDAQLGAGAMGVVYRAFDTRLRRDVAIKQLKATADSTADLILDEARAAATLNHPNICTIHGVEDIDGQQFIVMELVEGQPLSALVPAQGLRLSVVLEYGVQIADAVAFAHAHGIVHRDLKCSNIVITRDGRPKVLDFGLARRLALPPEAAVAALTTLHFDIAGTPEYMSPEALRGDSCTPQSDVWSLGIVLYEMATGHRPFDERTPFDVVARVLSDFPVDVPDTMHPALAAIIKRCLAKQPERRYRQAGEVRAALEAVQGTAKGIRLPPAMWLRAGRRRGVAMLAAGAVVVAALVMGFQPLGDVFDSLVSEPAIAFAERDWLLVSDFANETGDPVFDRSLHTALSAAIGQSRYVNIVPSTRIRESLRRMQRGEGSATDLATAREIALREGFRIVLAPTISSSGEAYVLTASLVAPADGVALRSDVVHARSRNDVLSAVDELSRRVRRALGEASALLGDQTQPLVQVTTRSLEALQRFSHGREAHSAQQLETARALYEEALALDPAFTAARASLGIINYEFFDREKGVELLRQAVKGIDGLTERERLSVLSFYSMAVERDLEKTLGHHKAFLAIHPDVASAHNNLGRVYLQMRRFPEAIAALQEAIRLDPDLFLAYSSLNSIYLYELGDVDATIETAKRQLARNDRAARAHAELGAAYAANGELRQAETALRRALELDPNPRFALEDYRLGHVLRLQGRIEEARQVYLGILDRTPSEISAHYEAGVASLLVGDDAEARSRLRTVITQSEQYLKQRPRDGVRWLELAAAYARLGERARARRIALDAESLTADLPVERAGLQVVLGERDAALNTLQRAVDNGYRNIMWARLMTDLHDLQGEARYEELLRTMRRLSTAARLRSREGPLTAFAGRIAFVRRPVRGCTGDRRRGERSGPAEGGVAEGGFAEGVRGRQAAVRAPRGPRPKVDQLTARESSPSAAPTLRWRRRHSSRRRSACSCPLRPRRRGCAPAPQTSRRTSR
ncbi:MAG TPA: protein kinase [Vicinamibacterales bacterium]|nr:protein kinase [Vicinamibacterales bacterium]